jgi:hypothetical protein
MRPTIRCLFVFFAAMSLMAIGTPLYAQAPGRVYRGLFAGSDDDLAQGLVFTIRFGAGYDNNIINAATPVAGSQVTPSLLTPSPITPVTIAPTGAKGLFEQANATLTYSLTLSRFSIDLFAATGAYYYGSRRSPFVQHHRGSALISFQPWSSTRFLFSHTISFRPFYYLPGLAAPAIDDGTLGGAIELDDVTGTLYGRHTVNASNGTITQTFSRRVTASASVHYEQSRAPSAVRDFASRGAIAGMSFGIAKGLAFRIGYGVSDSNYGSRGLRPGYLARTVDVGLNFNRALSLTRKTTLAFNTGTTAVNSGGGTYYRLIGGARLDRELGRTWRSGIIYNRGVTFDETFGQPVPTDALSLGFSGLFSRRLHFRAMAGVTRGRFGFDSDASVIETAYGRSALTFGLRRNLGLSVDYAYFHHDFNQTGPLPIGFISRGQRQRIGVFVVFRAPLL